MAEYHVGCGLCGIYAGTLNKKKTMWINKSEVTDEVLGSAAQYLLFEEKEFRFEHKGNNYVLKVMEQEDEI